MVQQSKFWDRMAERYAKRPVSDEAAYQKKLQITQGYLRPDMEVLELGCGTGSTAIAHAPFVRHIRATDGSAKMLEIARRKADAGQVKNVTFEQVTVEALDVPDESVDAVLALSVLHLLENKEAALVKIHRMLKPGGVFVSSTACLGDFMRIFKVIAAVGLFLRLLPLVKVFKKTDLEDALVQAGFELDHLWQPGKNSAVFIVAKKAA